jgi:SET domain-containing protein
MPRRPFRIGRSLTGLGLFATRPIKKNSRIAEYTGPILDHATATRAEARGNRYLFEVSKNRTIDGTPRRNVARYANHSCNPNAEPVIWRGRVFIKSLRAIKPGEEIVYDYGIDYLRNVIGRSNCKCSRCRRRRARRARELRALKQRRAVRLARERRARRKAAR